MGFGFVAQAEAFTDAEAAAKAARRLTDKADLVLLDVATFPAGKVAGAFFDSLDVPLALWGRDESEHGTHIGHNSFCGVNFLASNLALTGRRFRHFHGRCDSKDFRARLRTAGALIAAAMDAAGSRIGLFGEGIVPKFFDIDISPADRDRRSRRWNISFEPITIKHLLKRVEACKESDVENALPKFVRPFKAISVPPASIRAQVRLMLAIRDITREADLASLAVRCWPELPDASGVWPCAVLSALNESGVPSACEGDPGGALDMLLAGKLTDRPVTLLDLVDFDERDNAFAIWHCGPTATSWSDRGGAKLIPHDVDGADSRGRPAPGLPAVVDMQFKPGPVTMFRTLGAVDDEFVVQGRIVPAPKRRISGCFGMLASPAVYGREAQVGAIRDNIIQRAIPHHYAAARGKLFY